MSIEYMSQEGYDKLVAELQQMVNVELPQVKDAIAEARDKGDLSENFEYHAAKREQARLLGRIRFKQRVLENARVIDTSLLHHEGVQLLNRQYRIGACSDIDTIVLLDLAHDEGALDGTDVVDVTQFVEYKLLIMLHVLRAYL